MKGVETHMHNSTTIVGNLTGLPVHYTFASGAQLAKFRLATSRYRKNERGGEEGTNRQSSSASESAQDSAAPHNQAHTMTETTTDGAYAGNGYVSYNQLFIDVECWGNLANNVMQTLGKHGKGTQVVVVGDLIHKEWHKEDRLESRVVLRATNIGIDLRKYACSYRRHEVIVTRSQGADLDNLQDQPFHDLASEPEANHTCAPAGDEHVIREIISLDDSNSQIIEEHMPAVPEYGDELVEDGAPSY